MYEIGTITYSVPDLYIEKRGPRGPWYFSEGGGALALDDGACDPLLFQKGGIFPTTNKTLKGHSYLIFHIKRSSGVHADRNIILAVMLLLKPEEEKIV